MCVCVCACVFVVVVVVVHTHTHTYTHIHTHTLYIDTREAGCGDAADRGAQKRMYKKKQELSLPIYTHTHHRILLERCG